jgi:hypothetical protein
MRALADIEQRLAGFRAEVAAWDADVAAAQEEAPQGTEMPAGHAPARALTHCAICEKLGEVAFDYMAGCEQGFAHRRRSLATRLLPGGRRMPASAPPCGLFDVAYQLGQVARP